MNTLEVIFKRIVWLRGEDSVTTVETFCFSLCDLPFRFLPQNVQAAFPPYSVDGNLASRPAMGNISKQKGPCCWHGHFCLLAPLRSHASFTRIELFAFFQLTTSGLIVELKLAHKARIQKQGGFPQGFCRQVPRKPRPWRRGQGTQYQRKVPYREATPFRAGSFTLATSDQCKGREIALTVKRDELLLDKVSFQKQK